MFSLSPTILLTLLFSTVLAHKEPSSIEERQAYISLQSQIFHCAPEVAAYTDERKKSFFQRFLSSGAAEGLSGSNLFLDGAFEDNSKQKLLACEDVSSVTYKIKNSTCVLSPEVTQGPYYHTEGHPIRQNIAEWEQGLLFLMDIGVIDVETCQPLPDVLVDIWHANATGFYAGHPRPLPELVNEKPQRGGKRSGLLSAYPRTVHEETWLRGAWPTDRNGVAQFTSIFPGFYTGRATHVHVKAHTSWTTHPNGTFTTSNLIYTGQLFVPDEVNIQVDRMWPYSENPLFYDWGDKAGRTRNEKDSLNIFNDMHGNFQNPMFDIHKLNGVLTQGLIGYATLGLNRSNGRLEEVWDPNK